MPTTPFLTELDERAKVRGSRDPLGVQPVWDAFGRGVIGNLSTVSNSVRDFKVLLLGYWFVGRLAGAEDARESLNVFLRWEQLASFARARNGDARFRGTDRVQRTLAELPRKIRIAADTAGQILSDQQRYGLWGLFSVPAQNSGLLEGAPRRLSAVAQAFVEREYLPVLDSNRRSHSSRLLEGLARKSWTIELAGDDATLLKLVGNVLCAPLTAVELAFFREHLLLGGPQNPVRGAQEVFAGIVTHTLEALGDEWSPAKLQALARACDRLGPTGRAAASRVREIVVCESVLAPATVLFNHLLAHHDQPFGDVLARVRQQWGARMATVSASEFMELAQRVRRGAATDSTAARWHRIAAALEAGDYRAATQELLAQNAEVTAIRGGAPWVRLEGGKFKVMLRDGEAGALPKAAELPDLWRHAYFLSALRDIARDLEPQGER